MNYREKSLKTPWLVYCRNALATGLFLMVLGACEASAAPAVAASIKPLQLIAAAITDGITEPHLVLGNNQDPHHASLRPSDRKALAQADVILWVGPMLEIPLIELISDMSAAVLTVQNLDQIILHKIDGNPDPHVWLDTRNARTIAASLTKELQRIDSANQQRYADNLQNFELKLDQLDAGITRDFGPLNAQPWTVYHNAFRYFAEQFGLTAPLAPTENANNQAGIRSIVALRDDIRQQNISCMLTEPDMNHAELQTLLGITNLRIVSADIMGYPLEPVADAYPKLISGFAASLAGCLQNRPEL